MRSATLRRHRVLLSWKEVASGVERSGSKVGLIIVRKMKRIVESAESRNTTRARQSRVCACVCNVNVRVITDVHLLVRMSWRKGGGGEESERLQCWSHVIAVAAERSLEESWLGANTAE